MTANYWWAAHDPENALSPDYPWRPTLQVGSGMCISLEGVSFGSEEDCLDFIRTEIVGAGVDPNGQPRRDSVTAKLSDGEIQVPEDCPIPDEMLRAMNATPPIRRKADNA